LQAILTSGLEDSRFAKPACGFWKKAARPKNIVDSRPIFSASPTPAKQFSLF